MDSRIESSSLAGTAPDTIAISNVNLSLGTGAARVHILKDISLRVGSGETIGLIGPSGSGKSTLLMVMAGLERPDSGEVVVNGTPFNALDEDALARFRGRQVGIVFQSFHLIPTMTALENVAVPLELAGNPDAASARRRSCNRSGSATVCIIIRRSSPAASSSASRWPARWRPIPRSSSPTSRPAISTRPPDKQIVDLLFTKHAERGMTLVLVTHDSSLAQRCDRVIRLRSGRIDTPVGAAHEHRRRTVRAGRNGVALSLRYALRELRGGLRGFYVFIACIALGVMAIAGVGSVSASLSDGLAREGRTLLGGDVAFSLFQREAKPEEVAFLRSRGTVSSAATLRGMARAADGKLALVEMKAVDDTYPMLGQLTLAPPLPMSDLLARARRRVRRRRRSDAAGAARLKTRRSRHRRQRDVPDPQRRRSRARQARRRHRLRPALPDQRGGPARHRAAPARQPGALDLPGEAAGRSPTSERATDAFIADARNAAPQAGWEIRSRSNASPQLERNINRFTQFLTLVGLAALLVGGVGVANAVKSHIDRRPR